MIGGDKDARVSESISDKLRSAMRNKFGDHVEAKGKP
jgi:6-phosphogluconate dehydrogenase (decarboxylating)